MPGLLSLWFSSVIPVRNLLFREGDGDDNKGLTVNLQRREREAEAAGKWEEEVQGLGQFGCRTG